MLTDGVNFNLPLTLGCKAGEDGLPTLTLNRPGFSEPGKAGGDSVPPV